MRPLLDVVDLCRRFPVGKESFLHAVDNVSLHVQRGEAVGLVGESGCGKSTLVRMLTRVLDPSEGSIRFEDKEIGYIPAARFTHSPERGLIQMVFQDPTESLNPRFTAFDCIADPLKRLKGPWTQASLTARVEELASMVGLPLPLLTRFPHQLSGGQKARVGIARALGPEPRLLILDEPTSALDVSVQAVILKLLDDLRLRLNVSYLFVSHDLNVVRLLCSRVVVMYLGKVVESGPTDRVFDSPAHPYTRALLSAIPSARGAPPLRFRLSGEPRSPIDPSPQVCRFFGRCPEGHARCEAEMPDLQQLGPDHFAACHG
ncbi:Oligopeptide transport ATP-binding protein OppF [Paramagnetospirillum magnetotacticum MS-1]|uniref:Oligopeptide transport ATP-binding protein OppF n=1 Tax=Paramagnetospirillum magnetotacticum MS-1 TaxID=272627 RepID=A0A0C2YR38_PARME|nr:ABC transporter ATP-binding protein [Paramagnetospirillum magnetotacticum]KIL97150.1 Oligopeptide transport ATP-binding protein OppF [Paramagnetospirillum magnetotacticum MS-1]